MLPIRFEFSSVHSETLVKSLAELLGTEQENGVVLIPSALGTGSVIHKELTEGLVIVCWDFCLNADVVFAKLLTARGPDGRSLIVNYLLSADDIIMESPTLNRQFNLRGEMNVLLLPDDADFTFDIKAGIPVKVMTVSVLPNWLNKEFGNVEPVFTKYLYQLLHLEKPSVFMDTGTVEEFRVMAGILSHNMEIPHGILTLKPKVMSLVADFLSRISHSPMTDLTEHRMLHYQKMLQIEDILKTYLERNLPDTETLARMVALSSSTLKRHFKVVYGMGVYEHYLKLKMEHAKELLVERDITVNEAAAKLHYEKVSSFIDMFKKHHGYSPGQLRKKAS